MQNPPHRKVIFDAQGHQYVLETLLGRGSIGNSYRAVDTKTGQVRAVKIPLQAPDVGEGPQGRQLVALCEQLIRDQGLRFAELPDALTPDTVELVEGPEETSCLVMSYLEDGLLDRIREGITYAELCLALALTCEALEPIHEAGIGHGNLKPGNIFFSVDEAQNTTVQLTDPLTERHLEAIPTLAKYRSGLTGWLPPELESTPEFPVPPMADTFMAAKLLYEVVVEPEATEASYSGKAEPFRGGIHKAALKRFRTALTQRLSLEQSNPHLREQLIRRSTAFLHRALSTESTPSPPYRFLTGMEAAPRLRELHELVHPGFAKIGMLMVEDPTKTDNIFEEGEPIRFSLSFQLEGGIDDPELVTCMTYVHDLEENRKVPNVGIEVTPGQAGARFRFRFKIPRLHHGRFLVRVALAVRGSPGKPTPRDMTIEVRAFLGGIPVSPPTSPREAQPEREDATPSREVTIGAPSAPPAPGSKTSEPQADQRTQVASAPQEAVGSAPPPIEDQDKPIPAEATPSMAGTWEGLKPVRRPQDLVWSADDPAPDVHRAPSPQILETLEDVPDSSSLDTSSRQPTVEPAAEAIPKPPPDGPTARLRLHSTKQKDNPAHRTSPHGREKVPRLRIEAERSLTQRTLAPPGEGAPPSKSRLEAADRDYKARAHALSAMETVELPRQKVPRGGASTRKIETNRPGHDPARRSSITEEEGTLSHEHAARVARPNIPHPSSAADPIRRNSNPRTRGETAGGDQRTPQPIHRVGRHADTRHTAPPRPRTMEGKPGEAFIPELYYKEARDTGLPGEEEDEPLPKDTLRPQQYAFLIGVLSLILMVLLGLVVWVFV